MPESKRCRDMQSANASLFGPNPPFYISYIYDTTAFASFVHPEFATDVRDLWVICTLPSRPIWYVDPKHDEPGQVCCPWMRARAGDLVVSDPNAQWTKRQAGSLYYIEFRSVERSPDAAERGDVK